MEILQTIWIALTTENQKLIDIFSIFLTPIEHAVVILLITTIMNIPTNKKQKLLYIVVLTGIAIITNTFMPRPYAATINLFAMPITIFIVFKTSILKSILASLLPFIINIPIDTIFARMYLVLFGITTHDAISIPIYRIFTIILCYLAMFSFYKLADYFHFNISLLENMNKKNKQNLLLISILALVSIITQFYLITFYNDNLPSFIILLSIISLLAYFFVTFYSLTKTTKLELTTQHLEEEKLYNKTLTILHDNIRCFKHDFNNIVSSIGGYVATNNMKGLKHYYADLLADCQKANNLSALSPEVINNPPIYSLLVAKYYKADELGIKINLEIFLDLNTLQMKIYEFTRILGILLDNAIEAASECEEKIVNVIMRKDNKNSRQLVIIENTYQNKEVHTEKIFEKNFSSKLGNSGLGLWEIRQILRKNDHLDLFTAKDDSYFKQQFIIYA